MSRLRTDNLLDESRSLRILIERPAFHITFGITIYLGNMFPLPCGEFGSGTTAGLLVIKQVLRDVGESLQPVCLGRGDASLGLLDELLVVLLGQLTFLQGILGRLKGLLHILLFSHRGNDIGKVSLRKTQCVDVHLRFVCLGLIFAIVAVEDFVHPIGYRLPAGAVIIHRHIESILVGLHQPLSVNVQSTLRYDSVLVDLDRLPLHGGLVVGLHVAKAIVKDEVVKFVHSSSYLGHSDGSLDYSEESLDFASCGIVKQTAGDGEPGECDHVLCGHTVVLPLRPHCSPYVGQCISQSHQSLVLGLDIRFSLSGFGEVVDNGILRVDARLCSEFPADLDVSESVEHAGLVLPRFLVYRPECLVSADLLLGNGGQHLCRLGGECLLVLRECRLRCNIRHNGEVCLVESVPVGHHIGYLLCDRAVNLVAVVVQPSGIDKVREA